jgi:hypothetical protein
VLSTLNVRARGHPAVQRERRGVIARCDAWGAVKQRGDGIWCPLVQASQEQSSVPHRGNARIGLAARQSRHRVRGYAVAVTAGNEVGEGGQATGEKVGREAC